MAFSHSDMQEVRNIFLQAYRTTVSRYIDARRRETVEMLTVQLVVEHKPLHIVTGPGVVTLRDLIFENAIHTDFIQTLAFTFFGQWGEGPDKYPALVKSLSLACSVDAATDLMIMPSEFAQRLTMSDTVEKMLLSNRWVTVILLMALYINLEAEDGKKR